jgi:hypothetical protein
MDTFDDAATGGRKFSALYLEEWSLGNLNLYACGIVLVCVLVAGISTGATHTLTTGIAASGLILAFVSCMVNISTRKT